MSFINEYSQRLTVDKYKNRISNEAVNMGAELRKEEICRSSDLYIRQIDEPDERILRATDDISKAFRHHFQSLFTKETGFCGEEFHGRHYLTLFN